MSPTALPTVSVGCKEPGTWDLEEQAVRVLNFLRSLGDSLGSLEAGSLLRLYRVLDTRKPHRRCEIKVLEKC